MSVPLIRMEVPLTHREPPASSRVTLLLPVSKHTLLSYLTGEGRHYV